MSTQLTIFRLSANSPPKMASLCSAVMVKHMYERNSCLSVSAKRASHIRTMSGRSNSRENSVMIQRTV